MKIIEVSPFSKDAKMLMEELSQSLVSITGSSGQSSIQLENLTKPNAKFVIAYKKGMPVGCGAFRPLTPQIAEMKRMYAKYPGQQIGKTLLQHLEVSAKNAGYQKIWLETRLKNRNAVAFYQKNGYSKIANYGKYEHMPEAICFEKALD
ncbi:GNAT family N-acetyltransferase [Niallia sp. JL1B1071]|uniref:GNAT family N-acetyltransferase n=1 Tax=Niallia tiangongensis TaxID=3237105 RepID=UPI0037DDAF56